MEGVQKKTSVTMKTRSKEAEKGRKGRKGRKERKRKGEKKTKYRKAQMEPVGKACNDEQSSDNFCTRN